MENDDNKFKSKKETIPNPAGNDHGVDDNDQNEWHDHADTDKYLALEQVGVTYTGETQPTNDSDHAENGEVGGDIWNPSGANSRNSEAFNQDDYILNDNIDLDEDQNQSISSDDKD